MVLDAQPVEVLTEKILVLHTSFLGDSVLALPFLQELRKLHPSAVIDVVATPQTATVFRHSAAVDTVLVLDKRGAHRSLRATIAFAKETGQNGYTRLYSLHRSFRTALFVLYSGIAETYGFSNSSLPFVYRHVIQYRRDYHDVRRNLTMLAKDEPEDWKILPAIKTVSSPRIAEIETLGKEYRGIVGIAPGSVWETKRYPAEHFAAITKLFLSEGYMVLLLGSEAEKPLAAKFAPAKGLINLCGELNIIETTNLLRSCSLLITNDSALTHFGTAAGCPVLTIYCSTVPSFGFYPYGKNGAFAEVRELSCKPCGIHGYRKCPLGHFRCGTELLPDTVFTLSKQLLNGK